MRTARKLSNSGYMHLISRGIGHQIIFEDSDDYQFFLHQLARISTEECISVLAYCLMANHIHLLVYDKNGNTPSLMRRLGTTYAIYFNNKYERAGHVFQNRFMNQNIETETQLLVVFRYILNNPVKAGICPASHYEWSSFHAYMDPGSFVDSSLLERLIGDVPAFHAFMDKQEADAEPEIENPRHNDEWARQKLTESLSIQNGAELQQMCRADRDKALRVLKRNGLTIRQIERLTGISRGVIHRA